MKVVILAGGKGTRLAEETDVKPKPMVQIGDRPILRHIMEIYARQGHGEFILALGYRGDMIQDHFRKNKVPWKLDFVDTGLETQTGGRLRRLHDRLKGGTFMMTYGDGLANVDLGALLAFHQAQGKAATLTAVRPPARFGHIQFDGNRVSTFREKTQSDEGWINGGFFVLEPSVLDRIQGDETYWEREPMESLAKDGQLMGFRHPGFFQPMDTLRDKRLLEELWATGKAPWLN